MITAVFTSGFDHTEVSGLWQYDYGQKLRIQGLSLPPAVEIQFSLNKSGGDSESRVGITKDGVTDVTIPDSMLENGGSVQNYYIYAFIYITDETSGKTVKWVQLHVNSRPKPEAFDSPEEAKLFREAIAAVNDSADRAETAQRAVEEAKEQVAKDKEEVFLAKNAVKESEKNVTENKEYVRQAVDNFTSLAENAVDNVNVAGQNQVNNIEKAGQAALDNISTGVDETLTQSGKAADAEATGKAIDELKSDISNVTTLREITVKEYESYNQFMETNGTLSNGAYCIKFDVLKGEKYTFNCKTGSSVALYVLLDESGEVIDNAIKGEPWNTEHNFDKVVEMNSDGILYVNSITKNDGYLTAKKIVVALINDDDIDEIRESLKRIDDKVGYIEHYPINLFDPKNIVLDYRMDYNSKPASNIGSCITGKIPVKPNTKYHLHKPITGGERTLVIFNSNDQIVYATEALNDDGTTPYLSSGKYAIGQGESTGTWFITPNNASYVRFNIDWYPGYIEGHEYGWQLEEGDSYSGPQDYFEPYKSIALSDLPMDYRDIPERIENLEDTSSGSVTIVDVHSSDKIGFFSNSFLEGYAMYGQHAIERVMQFCDYIGYNYSKSGDDMAEETYRLNADYAQLGDCKPSEIGTLKYGIIMHHDNDGILFSMNHRTYYENAKHLGYAIMSLGGEPVISTEHDWGTNYLVFQRLCQDEGWEFLNWGKISSDIQANGRYTPFWHSGHPATRTNWMQVYGFLPFITSRPRPTQSMKLFRLRSSVDDSNLKNLLYNTILERIDRFQEIHTGQTGLTDPKYFDRFGSTGYSTTKYLCEYQKLIKNNPVVFGGYLLADITTPYNVHSITYGELNIVGTGISNIYARKIRYMSNCWMPSGSAKYLSFGVTSGIENLPIGAQFTVSGITRTDGANINGVTFEVAAIVNNIVVTKTASGNTYVTSGTDIPICSISGVTMSGTYDYPNADYVSNWDTPLGEWEEITFENNDGVINIVLTKEQLEKFGVGDKYVFLAKGTDVTITDISFKCSGTSEKLHLENKRVILPPKKGVSILSKSSFNDSDTVWNNLSTIKKVVPITDGKNTETYPFSGDVREFDTNDWVSQKFIDGSISEEAFKEPTRLQVQILARYFPKYVLNDSDYSLCGVTPDSTFMAKLEVLVSTTDDIGSIDKQYPVTTFNIGGWWNVFTFEFYANSSYDRIVLKALDDNIQIGRCCVVKLN